MAQRSTGRVVTLLTQIQAATSSRAAHRVVPPMSRALAPLGATAAPAAGQRASLSNRP